jgi:hypothetical protein
MNTNPQHGRTETPINMLEPIEIDFMAGQSVDPARYGRTETPVNALEPIDVDFAVPHLVLTVRLSEKAETVDAEMLALDVLNLVNALGECEKAIGGRGLRLHAKSLADDTLTLTLAPVAVSEAAERIRAVAALLTNLTHQPTGARPILEALGSLEASPIEKFRAASVRRAWAVEVRIELSQAA